MRHSMKPDLRADYKIRLYTRPKNPFFEVSTLYKTKVNSSLPPNLCGHLWVSLLFGFVIHPFFHGDFNTD